MASREVSCEFPCVSKLPLWFRVNSSLFWPALASSDLFWSLPRARFGCEPQRRTRWGGAFVSMLPLWFRANCLAFRRSRCGFVRIPLCFDAFAMVSCEFRLPLRPSLASDRSTAHAAMGRDLRFDAPVEVSLEFPYVSMLPPWFRANSSKTRLVYFLTITHILKYKLLVYLG